MLIIAAIYVGSQIDRGSIGMVSSKSGSDFFKDIEWFRKHRNRRLLAADNECGKNIYSTKATGRIIGGRPAKFGAFPWVAHIASSSLYSGGKYKYACSGSLIGVKYVLSAAHCIVVQNNTDRNPWPHRVKLGEYDIRTEIDCVGKLCNKFGTQEIDVSKIIVHPQYKYYPLQPTELNDITILVLKEPAKLNAFVRPVCLPYEVSPDETYEGQDLIITGWGLTRNIVEGDKPPFPTSEILKEINLPLFDITECKRIMTFGISNIFPSLQLCAGGKKDEDTCRNDSGGGLYTKVLRGLKRGRFNQVGILSWGSFQCGKEGHPGIYTKVRSYLPWILDSISQEIQERSVVDDSELILRNIEEGTLRRTFKEVDTTRNIPTTSKISKSIRLRSKASVAIMIHLGITFI